MATYEGKMIQKADLINFVSVLNDKQKYFAYCEQMKKEGKTYSAEDYSRKAFFACFRLEDKVPDNLCSIVFDIVARRFYKKDGSGYNGVISEIKERIELYSMIDGYVKIREFLVHKAGKSDFYDRENKTSYEMKTGAGDWLRSESPDFSETIAIYERKKTRILWDVNHIANPERKNDHDAKFTIETSYKTLFAFLSEYKGKGLESWFIPNKKSGRAGIYVWKLQEFYSSASKINYLSSFAEWEKVHR